VLNPNVLSLLPSKTLTVTYKSGASAETHTFTDPLLRDVLGLAEPQFDPAVKNDTLRAYVSATGSDAGRRLARRRGAAARGAPGAHAAAATSPASCGCGSTAAAERQSLVARITSEALITAVTALPSAIPS
jgi:hypothetical protein